MDSKPTGLKRVIKRYSNRKLYDTRDSRYVTLLQIGELVRRGDEVQIIDNTSKEDLTEVTLAQIVFEEQKVNHKAVPLQTLKTILNHRAETVLTQLREGPIGRFIPNKGEEEAKLEAAAAGKPGIVEQAKGTLEDLQHRIDERVRAVLPSILPWQQLHEELRRLQARVEELEKRAAARK